MADSPTRSPLPKAPSPDGRDTLHLQASPLLLIGVIGGLVSTVAVVIAGILAGQPPPPARPGGLSGTQPPPPPTTALVALIISAAFFVISWVTVAVAVALAQRMAAATAARSEIFTELHSWMEQIRVEAATDRASLLTDLTAQLDSFAEQRETEGYLQAMRAAAAPPATNGDVASCERSHRPRADLPDTV